MSSIYIPLRLRVALSAALAIAIFLIFTNAFSTNPVNPASSLISQVSKLGKSSISGKDQTPVSYDRSTPPSIGCEAKVTELQSTVLQAFAKELKGIRYANIFGYLGQTENKGDAAIWVAQDILLATLGIQTLEVCRYVDKDCDLDAFSKALEDHKPHSAIIMAGGGNFNDFYMNDHPARLKMAKLFHQYPIRAFPQSINMTIPKMIERTAEVFNAVDDIQLAARDQPSFDFLQQTFGTNATVAKPNKVKHILTPDVAFMIGNRPDIRLNTKKTHQVYILMRDDKESLTAGAVSLKDGEGHFDFGSTGRISYLKNDWQNIKTPDLEEEEGKSQRNWAKTMQGLEILASAEFVITDRLHGHILCTVLGIPHVLLDSKLKKNLYFHDTWTKDCDCTRIADTFEEALTYARMYFAKQKSEGSPGWF